MSHWLSQKNLRSSCFHAKTPQPAGRRKKRHWGDAPERSRIKKVPRAKEALRHFDRQWPWWWPVRQKRRSDAFRCNQNSIFARAVLKGLSRPPAKLLSWLSVCEGTNHNQTCLGKAKFALISLSKIHLQLILNAFVCKLFHSF